MIKYILIAQSQTCLSVFCACALSWGRLKQTALYRPQRYVTAGLSRLIIVMHAISLRV